MFQRPGVPQGQSGEPPASKHEGLVKSFLIHQSIAWEMALLTDSLWAYSSVPTRPPYHAAANVSIQRSEDQRNRKKKSDSHQALIPINIHTYTLPMYRCRPVGATCIAACGIVNIRGRPLSVRSQGGKPNYISTFALTLYAKEIQSLPRWDIGRI